MVYPRWLQDQTSGFVRRMNRAGNGSNTNASVQQAQPIPSRLTAIPSRLVFAKNKSDGDAFVFIDQNGPLFGPGPAVLFRDLVVR
jgi:hypothetical protein